MPEIQKGEPNLAVRYAGDTDRTIAKLLSKGFKPAAFMVDSAFISNRIPDFVTLGKPVGNGYPLGLVVTSPEILNAKVTGEYLRQSIRSLMEKHTIIGDVSGKGMLAGVELVRNRKTLEPADKEIGEFGG
ncbi:MAG: hypothetical protein J7L71_10490 [Spirochaetaceae bacterium]|nr:hypothetical protein [Spirochaetaceae bacterium]